MSIQTQSVTPSSNCMACRCTNLQRVWPMTIVITQVTGKTGSKQDCVRESQDRLVTGKCESCVMQAYVICYAE